MQPTNTALRGLSAGTFAAISAIRGKRVFHPIGRAFEGALVLTEAAGEVLPKELTQAGQRRVVVRLSRGAGLPEPLPDVLGLAIKIPDAYGIERDQDWLLASSGKHQLTRHLLLPALDFLGATYSTVLPYRVGSRLGTFRAFPREVQKPARTFSKLEGLVRSDGFGFTLTFDGERSVLLGDVDISSPLSQEESDRFTFNPWNSHPDVIPAGRLNRLRHDSYRASQQARPDA